jgi:hypothetical protein
MYLATRNILKFAKTVLWSGARIKSCWGLQRGKVGLTLRKTLASRIKRRHQQKWTTIAFQGSEGRENIVLPAFQRVFAQSRDDSEGVAVVAIGTSFLYFLNSVFTYD